MLLFMEKKINIGINPQSGPKQRHGVLWIGTDQKLPFVLDRPHLVAAIGLSYATWKRVKKQLDKMGVKATHIELDFTKRNFENGAHFCYRLDKYEELYCSGAKGKPLYETLHA